MTTETTTDTSAEFSQDDAILNPPNGQAANGAARPSRKPRAPKANDGTVQGQLMETEEDGATALERAKKLAVADLAIFQGKVDRLRELLGMQAVEWPEQQVVGSNSGGQTVPSGRPSRAPKAASPARAATTRKVAKKAAPKGKGGPKGPRAGSRTTLVLEHVKAHPGSSAKSIADAIGAEVTAVSGALNQLKKAGKVNSKGTRRDMHWAAV